MDETTLQRSLKNYKFLNCSKTQEHQYYQLNQTCLVDNCEYQLEPLCALCLDQKVFGHHQHQPRPIKQILQEVAENIEQNKIKYGSAEFLEGNEQNLTKLFEIAKDYRQIGESCLNISDYLMDMIGGTAGLKGLEGQVWDIQIAKNEEELRASLKKLRRHIRLDKNGAIKFREYKTPQNIIEKLNAKKIQIQQEVINLSAALRLDIETIKEISMMDIPFEDRKEIIPPEKLFKTIEERTRDIKEKFKNEELAKLKQEQEDKKFKKKSKNQKFDEMTKKLLNVKKVEMIKSPAYSKYLKEYDENQYEGRVQKCELIYSTYPISAGIYELVFKITSFGSQKGHLFVVLLREEQKDTGSNFFSPYHCIFCREQYEMNSLPYDNACFGEGMKEDQTISALTDIDNNLFEIRLENNPIYYQSKTQLQGSRWRLAIWWNESNSRVKIL